MVNALPDQVPADQSANLGDFQSLRRDVPRLHTLGPATCLLDVIRLGIRGADEVLRILSSAAAAQQAMKVAEIDSGKCEDRRQ